MAVSGRSMEIAIGEKDAEIVLKKWPRYFFVAEHSSGCYRYRNLVAIRSESALALLSYRKENGLSARRAAGELSVTHVALRSWETGKSVPEEPYRQAMERWSGGRVLAGNWGASRREKLLQRKLASVTPRATGTDGHNGSRSCT